MSRFPQRGSGAFHLPAGLPPGRRDYAARDFSACVAGRLGREIVRPAVYDNGPAEDIRHAEAVGQHSHPCEAGQVRKQRRQVARVIGVRAAGGIVMRPRVGKRVARVAGAGRVLKIIFFCC